MAEEGETSAQAEPVQKTPGRKGFISPTSSFVDFVELESEYYTEEGIALAHLYNPHKDRKIRKPTTDFETAVHVLKGSVGAGMLAMPKAFQNAGIIPGIVGTVLFGILCVYGLGKLIRMQYIQCQRLRVPFLTLPRSMKIALLNGPKGLKWLAPVAPFIADFFLVSFQLGICTAYVIFIAESIKDVMEPRLVKEPLHLTVYMAMIFIPVVLINFIRNLKKLTPVSLTANILILIALCCVFYYIFGVGPFKDEEVNMVSSVKTWPLFIGTALFAIEAVGVVIALEHNMENPQNFLGLKGIFPWSMLIVVTLYLIVGLLGYTKYGKGTKETIIASLPRNEWLSVSVEGVYALCIFGSYPLQCYVSLEILWGNYIHHHINNPTHEFIIEFILRITVVIITFVGAILIPHVDIMISLVGVFCLSILGIVFPFVMEMCTLWPDQLGCCKWVLAKDIVFILLGLFILIIGTYVSLLSVFD